MSVRSFRMPGYVLALATITFGVSACSGASAVSQSELEDKVTSFAQERYGDDAEVSCDGELDAEVDATQQCTVKGAAPADLNIEVTATDVKDDEVEFEMKPVTSPTGDGGEVEGSGYTLSAPEGWSDATETIGDSNTSIDLAISAPAENKFATNVNVIAQPASKVPDLKAAADPANAQGKNAESLPEIEIDGEPAYGVSIESSSNGNDLVQQQYYVAHGDKAYAITYSALADNADPDEFQSVLDSWSWA